MLEMFIKLMMKIPHIEVSQKADLKHLKNNTGENIIYY
jgi:hypothetical protein